MKQILLLLLLFPIGLCASIRMSPLFSDGMVLQQNGNVPFLGEATPNKKIEIKASWTDRVFSGQADAAGKFRIDIPTPQAGGPYDVILSQGKDRKVIKNILLGEVWLCSGQSNMEMHLMAHAKVVNALEEKKNANYPSIRLFKVAHNMQFLPTDKFAPEQQGWQVCTPDELGIFSAVGYFFGRKLHQELNMPIGLIDSSWGGTTIEFWTSTGALKTIPEYQSPLSELETKTDSLNLRLTDERREIENWNNELLKTDMGYQQKWMQSKYNDSKWDTMHLPMLIEKKIGDYDGIVWFRRTIEIPLSWQGKELYLSLGAIDEADITFVNGIEVGRQNGWRGKREYIIPANLTNKKRITVVIRISDQFGSGGLYSDDSEMFISYGNEKKSISGDWKYKPTIEYKKFRKSPKVMISKPNKPTILYNGMINPLIHYPISGAIWYQGESNTYGAEKSQQYQVLMPLMIQDWRKKWNQDFPFYMVQLANFTKRQTGVEENSNWAFLRDAQLRTLSLEKTGMAVTIDIGEEYDVHPGNKQEVGLRLALQALATHYGKDVPYAAPIYNSYTIENGKIRLKFKMLGGKFAVKGDSTIVGFTISGQDQKFYPAKAELDGNDILVWSDEVEYPLAVRYAWANNPVCNLYSASGFPVSPFRTDIWYKKNPPQ